MYGTPNPEDIKYAKQHLFAEPLGGLEGAVPQTGWSFVQIPGILRCFLTIFASMISPKCEDIQVKGTLSKLFSRDSQLTFLTVGSFID